MLAESLLIPVRWFESAVGVKSGGIEDDVELAVSQGAAGRIKVKLFDRIRDFVHRLSILCLEREGVIAELVWCSLQLFENV